MKCVYHYYRDQPGLICKTILFRSAEKEKNNCGFAKAEDIFRMKCTRLLAK